MRKIVIISGIAALVFAITAGIFLVPGALEKNVALNADKEKESRDYSKAIRLLDSGKSEKALSIIHQYSDEMESLSKNGVRWMELFIAASEETKDTQQLAFLFEFFPEIYKNHETASLLVADAYITQNRLKDYKKIRSLWTDRETKIPAWFVLDADKLLLEGRRRDAIAYLKSRSFNDRMDVGRLLRLALLYANDEPKTAWKYLGEAYAKDPQNPDIRSYRAKLLETVGKNNQAHQEYLAAVKLQPSNLFLKEQLAEFYLRKKQYPMALQVYEENLSPPSLDTIWMKAWFWNRVTHPINFDWNKAAIPQGALDDLVTYAIQLKPGVFWDRQKFDRVKNGKFYLKNQQEIYWLRLLQDLKEGNENNAVSLLKYNPFHSTSWDPALENALKRILAYRKTGFFDVEEANIPNDHLDPHAHDVDLPPFFQEIEELANLSHANVLRHKVPDDLHELLISKEVFAVAFLSAGWLEAGLNLRALTHIPEQLPEWVSVMEAKALEQNRSFLEALEYAEVQPHTPALTLFAAELLISGGDALRALEKLKGLVKLESDIGYRAAWLSSLIYLENNDYNNARTVIYAQPLLVNDQLGQETLAQIAHEEGDHELAGRLYVSLEDKSSEARSFLARKAFEEKNWQKARELTEKLIQDYPDDPMLKDNLLKIEKAARKSRNAPMNHAKGTVLRSLKPKKRS